MARRLSNIEAAKRLTHREVRMLTSSPCEPAPAHRHHFERQVRDHPTDPDLKQDSMSCTHCHAVLYPWESYRPVTKEPTP